NHVSKYVSVQEFLSQCELPKRAADVTLSDSMKVPYEPVPDNPIKHIIAIDGGYSEIAVQTEFPSATICFFQMGALIFSVEDLETINEQAFIDPDDMAKLKNITRLKVTLRV